MLGECRAQSIESPTPDRVNRIVRSGLHQAEQALTERIAGRLPAGVRARLLALVQVPDSDVDEADPRVLALIKAATGNVSLSSMLTEVSRLEAVRGRVAGGAVRRRRAEGPDLASPRQRDDRLR